MKYSPFFSFIIVLFFFSCKKSSENQIVSLDKTVNKEYIIALGFQKKADSLDSISKYNEAFYYYNKSKNAFDSQIHKDNIAYCLIQMARLQQVSGDYFGSESTLIEALKYSRNNYQYLSALNNLFGIASKELKNYNEALIYYKTCYKLAVDEQAKSTALNNIAKIYSLQNNNDAAISIWKKIILKNFLDTLPKKKALYIDNLGYTYFKKGEKEKALGFMKDALQIRLKENDSYGSIESYLHLTEFFFNKNNATAQQYAYKAYKEASLNNSIDEKLKALLYLIKINSKRELVLKYASLKDSIINVRSREKNQFAKIKYDAKVFEEENLKLKNKNITVELALQKSQNEKNIWLLASGLLACFLFILYNYLKNKNKLEKQKATYFTETKIAKKIHDEIANDVFQTMSFVEAKKIEEPENKETLINLLDNLYQRSRNISKENESIETGESFIENLMEMINGYKSLKQNVIIKKDENINWSSVSEIKKITLFRVLQELLVNMKKHSQASIIIISFSTTKNDITIDYSDNGKGMEMHQVKKSGIANAENRIQDINGSITFDTTSNGLKVKISIPK